MNRIAQEQEDYEAWIEAMRAAGDHYREKPLEQGRVCPRCSNLIRRAMLSRTDNETVICLDCGLEEALETIEPSQLTPRDAWPVSDWRGPH